MSYGEQECFHHDLSILAFLHDLLEVVADYANLLFQVMLVLLVEVSFANTLNIVRSPANLDLVLIEDRALGRLDRLGTCFGKLVPLRDGDSKAHKVLEHQFCQTNQLPSLVLKIQITPDRRLKTTLHPIP